ncbi:hypothetical protein FH608_018550 [Nonomuraea phyllanthi]|uniref:Uncharacterized protein n=1 Tax=Nonomuraea phyllanthi TaxID=2219224 RepID=A0A5C4WK15_9ACTN|nr:hypothetical protein FH608_018550 [Nonomuraea phyllanthi]
MTVTSWTAGPGRSTSPAGSPASCSPRCSRCWTAPGPWRRSPASSACPSPTCARWWPVSPNAIWYGSTPLPRPSTGARRCAFSCAARTRRRTASGSGFGRRAWPSPAAGP